MKNLVKLGAIKISPLKIGALIIGGLFIFTLYQKRGVIMQYFTPSEFGDSYHLLDNELKLKLDDFRRAWGQSVSISKHPQGVARHDNSNSQHNVNKWGKTRAVDIFPLINGARITSLEDAQKAVEIAKKVGFTGIGVYSDTINGMMLHVDVRPGARVATWGRVNGQYVGLDAALLTVEGAYA